MANDKTQIEQLEDQANDVMFGKVKGLGNVDKSMLERSATNKLVWDSHQSALDIANRLIYKALYTLDNLKPEYERVRDDQTGEYRMLPLTRDYWSWLITEIEKPVFDNQLTVKGYSRSQHLRQTASAAGVSDDLDEQPGFWQRIFR